FRLCHVPTPVVLRLREAFLQGRRGSAPCGTPLPEPPASTAGRPLKAAFVAGVHHEVALPRPVSRPARSAPITTPYTDHAPELPLAEARQCGPRSLLLRPPCSAARPEPRTIPGPSRPTSSSRPSASPPARPST